MSYRIDVPQRAHELCSLNSWDYADAFAADGVVVRSPRKWVDEYFGQHPRLARAVPVVHGVVLRMRLDGPRESYGWRVVHETDHEAVLSAEGDLMTAQIAAYSTPEQAVFATFVHYNHRATQAVWAAVSIAHRNLASAIVGQAARRISTLPADSA